MLQISSAHVGISQIDAAKIGWHHFIAPFAAVIGDFSPFQFFGNFSPKDFFSDGSEFSERFWKILKDLEDSERFGGILMIWGRGGGYDSMGVGIGRHYMVDIAGDFDPDDLNDSMSPISTEGAHTLSVLFFFIFLSRGFPFFVSLIH